MMKHTVVLLLCLGISLAAFSKKTVSDEDLQLLETAISDSENSARRMEAMKTLEQLSCKYPDDYVINYETILLHYRLGEYDQVLEKGKKWLKAKDNDPLIYQIYGNALSQQGKPNEALDIYGKGLKRYPSAGMLYLEGGNVYMQHDYTEQALKWYNEGIERDPEFPSNYYRAADLYFQSESPVWGLIYAETEMLLNHSGLERFEDMAREIVKCLDDKIVIEKFALRVNLAKSHDIILMNDSEKDSEGTIGVIGFDGVYESCASLALATMFSDSVSMDKRDVKWLSQLRGRILDFYYSKGFDQFYGDAMYLLVFQKKIKDAGHWEAYNRYLFRSVFPAECDEWNMDHPEAMDRFIDWYNDSNWFSLGSGKSVGQNSIYRYFKPKPLTELMELRQNMLRMDESDEDIKATQEQ